MKEFLVDCPCCGNKIKITIDASGNTTAFLLQEKEISVKELSQKFGIDLGADFGS